MKPSDIKFKVVNTKGAKFYYTLMEICLFGYISLDHVDVFPFTGFTHKGDDLYEGDIMRITLPDNEGYQDSEIKFENGQFVIGNHNHDPLFEELEYWGDNIDLLK